MFGNWNCIHPSNYIHKYETEGKCVGIYFQDINSISLCFPGKVSSGLKFARVIVFNGNLLGRLKEIRRQSPIRSQRFPSQALVGRTVGHTEEWEEGWYTRVSQKCSGMKRRSTVGGGGGSGSQMTLNRGRRRYGDIKWRRQWVWEERRHQDDKVRVGSPPVDSWDEKGDSLVYKSTFSHVRKSFLWISVDNLGLRKDGLRSPSQTFPQLKWSTRAPLLTIPTFSHQPNIFVNNWDLTVIDKN